MNPILVVTGTLEIAAGFYGLYAGQGWRFLLVNVLVGLSNIIFAGMK